MELFCKDIFIIISSYLYSINDIISLHNVNNTSRQCIYDITLYSRKKIPKFIYNSFNIVKICSTFTDYSDVDNLLTDNLLHLSVSHKNKDDYLILNKISELRNLCTFKMYSKKFTDTMFENMAQLESLDLGQYQSIDFDGKHINKLINLKYLNLGDNMVLSKYVNNLTKLEHLIINTEINTFDFSLLVNLKTLDVSRSNTTLTDSNIYTLINLRNLRCRYSTITNVEHLLYLEVLYIGLNYILKSISNLENLKILSIINSNMSYINLPNLMELSLNELITDDILRCHTKLTYLYMGTNTEITNFGIETLVNLKYIHCNMNKNITSEGFNNITKLVYLHAGMSYINLDNLKYFNSIKYAEHYDPYLGNLESVILFDNRSY